MAPLHDEAGLRDLRTLLSAGNVEGLSDRQLLERYVSGSGDVAERAFASLVERHGPLVLRTCRGVLGEVHEAEDAFQATFLILSRRAGSLWIRESLGPWLHRVATRVALRARSRMERRRKVELRSIDRPWREPESQGTADREVELVLHQELDRLPECYRAPILLFDLEGSTYEEVARRLCCPVGTVKSRLARGRERLKARLLRRGLAPGAIVPASLLDAGAQVVVPGSLVGRTVGAALNWGKAVPGGFSPLVVELVEGMLGGMSLARFKVLLIAPIALATLWGGLSLGRDSEPQPATPGAQKARPEPAKPAAPTLEVAKAPAATWSWRSLEPYEPPDYARFFPDDSEAGKRLDALWKAPDREQKPDAEILATTRQGLRRTQVRAEIVRWIGQKYVWGRSPQNPDAVEIMYHASDFLDDEPTEHETRGWAVYFGLTVVEPKPPAILHALADFCMRGDDPNDLGRIGWGTSSQNAEIMAYLKPYLESAQPRTREKGQDVARILSGELDAFEWAAGERKRRAREHFAGQLPRIKKVLVDGNSAERTEALRRIQAESIALIMDASFVPAFASCARDDDPGVRRLVAQVFPGLIAEADAKTSEALDLVVALANDKVHEVRYDMIYYGVSWMGGKLRDDVVGSLVAFVLSNGYLDMQARIVQRLKENQAAALPLVEKALQEGNPAQIKIVRQVFRDLTGQAPPGEEGRPGAKREYEEALIDLHEHLGRVYPNFSLKGIDWAAVGRELIPRVAMVGDDQQFGLLVEEMVARLEDTHAQVIEGKARPPAPKLPEWDPGFACLIDARGRPVVYSILRGSPAEKAGIRVGMAVVSANEVPAETLLNEGMSRLKRYFGYSSDRSLKYDAVRGLVRQEPFGSKVALVLEDPRGQRETVEVAAECGPRYLPRMPVPRKGVDDSANVSWARLSDGIGYLYVRRIQNGLEAALELALKGLGDIRGLVIDVRGNSGGGFDVRTAFRNFDPAAKDESSLTRYKGPIALLVDERTTSAGEGWASWFIARKRARVFGTTTAGASARKEVYTMRHGLYRVVVPVKAYAGFLDRPIERRGLEPDVPVVCNAEDLEKGVDTVVTAAVDWLRSPQEDNPNSPAK
ncbi:sigma-70 family RNA polymerase sigma factor [Singulisphaera sp. PoT]|uniref:sigma-70 family RNA polymerase sigma factor n=1 Tax=Singulisphaera sp. PoT TaxID=3411797 RepID=UPI003BF5FFEC